MNAQAQDPSYLVHNQLLPHLHLMSTYQFPLTQRIGLEQVLNHLLQAPQIVREMKPMAWSYLSPPQDGTMFITWQAPRMGQALASDGYIWTDMEGTFRQQVRGYELEILVHRAGYLFNQEAVATHQRIRYHLVAKDPSLPSIDPSFWLVHYSPSDASNRHPVNNLPIHPQIQKIMQERQFLEQQQGILQRKEFMLLDRANWPTVNTNSRQPAPQMHPQYQQPMARPQPPHYPQAAIQQPAAKRVKVDRGVAPTTQADNVPDIIFQEDTEFGDYFDNLTPAEISKMRYKQHHEWMEEIYSSVYSLSQIVPEDLGLGLTGSLKELTEGIFTAPDPQQVIAPFNPDKNEGDESAPSLGAKPLARTLITGSRGYEKLTPEKMEDFEKRIAQYVEKGKADVQAMKEQHADTVAHFNKSKTYMKAERKLRDAKGDDVEIVVREVETSLPARVVEQKSKVCVEEGGLEKEDRSRVVAPASANSNSSAFAGNGTDFVPGDNSAAGLLDEFGSGSFTNSPAARIGTPAISHGSGVPTPSNASRGEEYTHQLGEAAQQAPDESGMDLLEGMDLDVDMSGLDGSAKATPAEDEWVMVGDREAQAQSGAAVSEKPTTPAVAAPAEVGAVEGTTGGDLFDSADFGDTFDGLDSAGDALADFDTGGHDDMGLDLGGDDTFGDAFGTPGREGTS